MHATSTPATAVTRNGSNRDTDLSSVNDGTIVMARDLDRWGVRAAASVRRVRIPLLLTAFAVLVLAQPAHAARVATPDEQTAINGLLAAAVGDTCDSALKVKRSLPLVAAGDGWGIATEVCEFTDPPSGAGTSVWTVWAHRPSPAATDWTTVGPTEASRVPPCTGDGGLFTRVPEAVVRDLREECVNAGSLVYRPAPIL